MLHIQFLCVILHYLALHRGQLRFNHIHFAVPLIENSHFLTVQVLKTAQDFKTDIPLNSLFTLYFNTRVQYTVFMKGSYKSI